MVLTEPPGHLTDRTDAPDAGEVFAFPLSYSQEQLWILDRLEERVGSAYNESCAVRLSGALDEDALARALNALVRRHEALRTIFTEIDGEPRQIVTPALLLPLDIHDLGHFPQTEREDRARALARDAIRVPFDLTTGPLIRATLFRLAGSDRVLLITTHHIVSDGWTISLLFRELSALYAPHSEAQQSRLDDPPIQYADYAIWQREWVQSGAVDADVAYWRERLADLPQVCTVPGDGPRPATQTFEGARVPVRFDADLVEAMRGLARAEGATLFMALLGAFQALLARYTGQDDVFVGSPIAGRGRAETEGVAGDFLNPLVLRTDLSGDPMFREVIARVREVALGAFAHQDLPFEMLVQRLQPTRSLSYPRLFQVMFVLQDGLADALRIPGVVATTFDIDPGTAKLDLTLSVFESSTGLDAWFEYNTALYSAGTIERLQRHFQILLRAAMTDPQLRLSQLPLLASEERELLRAWNDTAARFPIDHTIHELFEAQADRTPDATALTLDGATLTFHELNARANRLARHLQRQAVEPGATIGVCLERSFDSVTALLAVLKAGAAYLPLDPTYPAARLQFMLSDSRAPVVLTQQHLRDGLPEHDAAIIAIDADADTLAQYDDTDLPRLATPESAAYLIYTSGSTGIPNGVVALHRGAINRFQWMWERYPFAGDEVLCHKTTLNFVDHVWEIFGPLLRGVSLALIPEQRARDPRQLVEALAAAGATRIVLVPSLLRAILDLDADLAAQLPRLCYWVTSGEAITTELVARFKAALPDATLINLYGQSEASADVTYYDTSDLGDAAAVPIGRPIANMAAYVLDSHLNQMPIGVAGELYVAGPGLARGYLERPELTAQRFVANPFDATPGARMYKTGDLTRWLPSGDLEFLGRSDYQVKVRGMRVDLGEVEAALRRLPAVAEAIATTREFAPGDERIVAYVTGRGDIAPPANELRAALRTELPDHMVPAAFVALRALPLTPNGKVDRLALPMPDVGAGDSYAAPRSELERQLVQLWEELLAVQHVGVHDSFFDLGGHSLLAAKLCARIESALGARLPVLSVFEGPTVAQLATTIEEYAGSTPWPVLVGIRPTGSKRPLFCIHPLGGDIVVYAQMTRHLDPERPVYGIQAHGMDGLATPDNDMVAMATSYIEEIRAVQPQGPYHLLGFSSGGRAAYEMAQQLLATGEQVQLLGVIDDPADVEAYSRFSLRPVTLYHFARFLPTWFGEFLRSPASRRARLRNLWRKLRRQAHGATHHDDLFFGTASQRSEVVQQVAAWIAESAALLPNYRRELIDAQFQASVSYQPQPFRGSIALFRAHRQRLWCSHDPKMGWDKLARGGVRVYDVPGNHMQIVADPHIGDLAEQVDRALADVER